MSEPEVIEGTAVEVGDSALVVHQPAGLARALEPTDMIAMASKMASALKDIVERQRLYAVISGKKYPQVEAWMTIARMDGVVAREAEAPVRHDDGSYEAFVELVRLADGMNIGRASALCGTAGDSPWDKRPEPARRSMAVTRATSRAFRQHYSWIMALAGYEPTPAEEMPREDAPQRPAPRPVASTPTPAPTTPLGPSTGLGLHGKASKGDKPPVDGHLRQTPTGGAFGFVLHDEGGKKVQVIAEGALAMPLATMADALWGAEVRVEGTLELVPWDKDGKAMPPFRRLHMTRIETPDFVLPGEGGALPVFPMTDDDELDAIAEGRR